MSKQDKTLVAVTVVFWAIMFMLLLAARPADARVTLAEPAAFSVGADDCSMFVEGCSFAQGMSGVSNREAVAEDSYYKTIKDGVAMGIDAFGLDMQANTTQATWLLARLSAAMKKYNGENPAAKRCIFASYRNAGGEALTMFNAADSNNSSDSPYCAVDGKPLVGIKQTTTCVNPLTGLTGKGPFVVLGTMAGAADGVPTKACVDTWKANGASRVISYPDAGMATSATVKATATGAGADYAVGVPATWARQCGGAECLGPASSNYTMRDGQGFLAAVTAMKAALADRSNAVFPFAFPGNYADGVSWERARICDSSDTVAKSGFTCASLPDRLRGTIPTGNAGKSNGNKAFMKAGLHRVGQWFSEKYKASADPAARPFIAWAHREHPLALGSSGAAMTLRKTWQAQNWDFTSYMPANSAFTLAQVPWNAGDMSVGDVFTTTALDAPNGFLRLRTVTGPLGLNSGMPKGSPSVTFGDHFDLRPAVRPLGDGVWSNAIQEMKVSVGGTATANSTGGYARAIQIHGFRIPYTGSAWYTAGSVDGDTYDIQVRYKTSGSYPKFRPNQYPSDVWMERKKIGPHTWDIYRTNGGWATDLGMTFVITEDVDAISEVDMKAILDYTLADANVRYNRNDTGIYVRGVQAWIEPRNDVMDLTIEGMVVKYNGVTYGAGTDFTVCPSGTTSVDTAKSLPGATGADAIYLTSYAPTDTRVRVSVGNTVLGTYTLPARQLDQTTPQTTIPLGAALGRPKFEVLDSAGNVIVAKDGEVSYTSTPKQRADTSGRNLDTYADSLDLPTGTQAAKASVVKVNADRAEGNAGTSESTFRITLDKPASASSTVNWSVSSATANATDFYHLEDTVTNPPGPQCSNVSAPPPAAASGFTKLAFCEDFSSPARVNTSTDGRLSSAQTFTQVTPGNIFKAQSMPASAFKFNADGTMTVTPTRNNYQINMISTVPTGGGNFSGYALPAGGNWYWETRWRHDDCSGTSGSGGFPALWSMSHLKIYASTANTYEPDAYEYISRGRINCLHLYPNAGGNDGRTMLCKNGSISNVNSFFTAGARASANGGRYEWFLNDSSLGFVTPTRPADFAKGRYPLMFGSGVPNGTACKYTVDFIRAWERP